jgi:hypothetical protein
MPMPMLPRCNLAVILIMLWPCSRTPRHAVEGYRLPETASHALAFP